jgi:hypothetical protein
MLLGKVPPRSTGISNLCLFDSMICFIFHHLPYPLSKLGVGPTHHLLHMLSWLSSSSHYEGALGEE